MPDLSKDVTFEGFKLNDSAIRDNIVPGGGIGSGISGSVIDSFDPTELAVVQFSEKRSEEDGEDVGVPFFGARRISGAATLYGTSKGDLSDRLAALRAAMSPTLAYRALPEDKGYRPLYFSERTLRTVEYSGDYIDFRALAMPQRLAFVEQRDQLGGEPTDALAIPYQFSFKMRQPIFEGALPKTLLFGHTGGIYSGNLVNRGSDFAPIHMLIHCSGAGGTVTVTLGGAVFTLVIPATGGDGAPDQIIRIDGAEKMAHQEIEGTNDLSMDIPNFTGRVVWPRIGPGTIPYSFDFGDVELDSDDTSSFWFWEAYS